MFKRIFTLFGLATVYLLVGCKTVDWKPSHPFPSMNQRKETSDDMGRPTQMTVIWKDSVIQSGTSRPTKGFGGRIYFNDSKDQPVKVDGELIVYGYDESNRSESSAPDHKYVFPSSEFQKHYSKSEIGHSYAIWIPWEKVGGLEKAISLIPVFKTTDGKVIQGGQSMCVLPGKKPEDQTVEKTVAPMTTRSPSRVTQSSTTQEGNGVVLASATATDNSSSDVRFAAPSDTPTTRIRASTVDVPRSLARRLAQLPPQTISQSKHTQASQEYDAVTKRLSDERASREKRHERLRERLDREQDETNTSPTQRPVFGQPGGFGG